MTTDTISVIILVLVVLFGLINAKIYNIIHGFLTIIGVTQILALISFVSIKQGHMLVKYNAYVSYTINAFTLPLQTLCTTLKLENINADKYTFYLIPIIVFVISFILASLLRKIRKSRED